MKFTIEKVLERDMDLLMINKFIHNQEVLDLFLNKINKRGYKNINVQHSYSDFDGENDITVIVEKDGNKVGLLIEDKIGAEAMPNQYERYKIRGQKGIKNNFYNEFYIFIIAPSSYLESNEEAKKYDYKISYEELKETMKNDIYATTLIDKAIEEKKNGYIIIEHKGVTSFWKKYYEYIDANYSIIKDRINKVSGPRGEKSRWPKFSTGNPNVKIIQKSNKGYLDLAFSKMENHVSVFNKYVKDYVDDDMEIVRTGKSMAIRLHTDGIDFRNPFENYSKEIEDCLNKVMRFYDFLKRSGIDIDSMYKEIEIPNADIKTIEDFIRLYPNGIIVNYDTRGTFRCSTNHLESIGNTVDYPYIQRYQTGVNTRTQLFIIKDNTLYKLKRVEGSNPNSKYTVDDFNYSVSEEFYQDKKFSENKRNPVNVFTEELLEITGLEEE